VQDIYLNGINVVPGTETPMTEIPELLEAGIVPALQSEGLGSVRIFERERWLMASRSVKSGDLPAKAVAATDTVVYSTMSGVPGEDPAAEAARFMADAGLNSARLLGVGFSRCANFGTMLAVGSAVVRTGDTDSCLLVTVDSAPPGQRLMQGEMGVFSDAAVSARLSTVPGSGYQLLGVATATRAELEFVSSMQEAPRSAQRFLTCIEDAVDRLIEAAGLGTEEFTHVVMNNYRTSSTAMLSEIVGMPESRTYRGAARGFGHCFTGDSLLNLHHLDQSGTIASGETVLVLSTTTNSWTLAAMRYAG
jgi:3-oxoacyl-[acyl-carrier-protein] synthase III